jgi:hypothetical protein
MRANLTPNPFPRKNGEGEQKSYGTALSYPPDPLSGRKGGTGNAG